MKTKPRFKMTTLDELPAGAEFWRIKKGRAFYARKLLWNNEEGWPLVEATRFLALDKVAWDHIWPKIIPANPAIKVWIKVEDNPS